MVVSGRHTGSRLATGLGFPGSFNTSHIGLLLPTLTLPSLDYYNKTVSTQPKYASRMDSGDRNFVLQLTTQINYFKLNLRYGTQNVCIFSKIQ